MIGVYCAENEKTIVREFFELFKTPWEFLNDSSNYDVVISTKTEMPEVNAKLIIIYSSIPVEFDRTENILSVSSLCKMLVNKDKCAFPIYGEILSFKDSNQPLLYSQDDLDVVAVELLQNNRKIIRVGFNLFFEISFLLSTGQPVEHALIPTIDIQISILRNWILSASILLVEIPPVPFGYSYFVCLTHDIDFIGLRLHVFDKTMWGFIYRGLFGSLVSFLRGRFDFSKLIANWLAVLKTPLVFLGVVDDFWSRFDKYAEIEHRFNSTFFLIPHKGRAGIKPIANDDHSRRAAPYGIKDVENRVKGLVDSGFEIGLHGIDAWHDVGVGSKERDEIANIVKEKPMGVRMHWLYYDSNSPKVLENIGFNYDASLGYNETIGFRNGTVQVFMPLGVSRLLEIPLNIQDTALFYPRRLALKYEDATKLCQKLMKKVVCHGGVLTLSWHDRSLEPERLWGDFYIHLLNEFQNQNAWIGSGCEVATWFRKRRSVKFDKFITSHDAVEVNLDFEESDIKPPMLLNFYLPFAEGGYRKIDVPIHEQRHIKLSLKGNN